jgi:hypothetical protein
MGYSTLLKCLNRELKRAKRLGIDSWVVGHIEGKLRRADYCWRESRKTDEPQEYRKIGYRKAVNDVLAAHDVILDFFRLRAGKEPDLSQIPTSFIALEYGRRMAAARRARGVE